MDSLIADLECDIASNEAYISSIRRPAMLLSALKGLNNMIGNQQLKDDVAKQVDYLIDSKNDPEETEPIMLHTLLYGGPGVGKSETGKHLARIWHSLGYIGNDRSTKSDYRSSTDAKAKKVNDLENLIDKLTSGDMNDFQEGYMMIMVVIMIISVLSVIWGYLWNGIKTCYNALGLKWMMIVLGVILVMLIILLVWSYFSSSGSCKKCKHSKCRCKPVAQQADQNQPSVPPTVQSVQHEVSDDDLIEIVSAEDFIGQYVGWTEQKTTALLQKSKGKVLFIDEAYSLVGSNKMQGDSYGEKALNIINRYMSEHPEDLIIIMAGYEDKIKDNLFKTQPGLVRRFMWSFDCKGYTPDELCEIWQQQIRPKVVADKEKTLELFRKYKHSFPNHAGDTLRLVNFAKLEQKSDLRRNRSARNADSSARAEDGSSRDPSSREPFTPDQIERAIQILNRNTMKNSSADDPAITPEMLQLFRSFSKNNRAAN